ncbi:YlmH family RNA-binding protein [Metabacillus arenae]|uniref:RNA-binding protein n=1 Tax=Metabacillus arenae TaxID=2771434 RepID=A0A926NFN6_9BACI|nr:RNA-binding protein [Metabacillus arenae]MBD1379950.1 RNA-binding protein [Metabacillus arenae]
MNSIYQHFRPEEHHFLDQVMEWKEVVTDQYRSKLTDFLDPREQEIIQAVVGQNHEVRVELSGGLYDTERKRALLYPEYYAPLQDDFELVLFELEYPSKFVTIQHRDVLGSLMSLGLKRSKFGDILTAADRIQVVVAKDVSDYLRMNFTEIGKSKISLKEIPLNLMLQKQVVLEEMTTTVSSLRLDAVASAIYKLSRQKIGPYISNGLVKVNFKKVEQPSFQCRTGDTISVRGIGRCKLIGVEGKTKKDKWRLVVGIQK